MTAQSGLSIDSVLSVEESLAVVWIDAVGTNPCEEDQVPAIDVHLTIEIRQACDPDTGELEWPQFRLWGQHDGFPWHELYINGVQVYIHDPCCTGEGPEALFDLIYNHDFQDEDECHPLLLGDGIPLDDWHDVP